MSRLIVWSTRPMLHMKELRKVPKSSARRSFTASSHPSRTRQALVGTTLVLLTSVGYLYLTDTRAFVHRYFVPPVLRTIFSDAEDAHERTIAALKALYVSGLYPRERINTDADGLLSVKVFGTQLANCIGISGGLDKNGEIPDALLALGPSVVEIGGITPKPQDGNEKPRVFRIPSENAIVNRYGLNSEGADVVALRLRRRARKFAQAHGLGLGEDGEQVVLDGGLNVPPGSLQKGRLLAVQIAKNKATPDDDLDAVVKDHVDCVEKLGKYSDILVVNVSSPNTPGLRALQSQAPLTRILSAVVDAAHATTRKTSPAVMVKVSPDENTESQVRGICEAVWSAGVDGIIVGNTTKLRPEPLLHGAGLSTKETLAMREQGGFSGPHLFERTVGLVRTYRQILDQGPQRQIAGSSGKGQVKKDIVLFASGGITNGSQALEVLNAGASVAMVYTALTYAGVGFITDLKSQMRNVLSLNG